MHDEVEADEPVDRLAERGAPEAAVVLLVDLGRVVEVLLHLAAHRLPGAERVVGDVGVRDQRASDEPLEPSVDLEEVGDQVTCGPVLAR